MWVKISTLMVTRSKWLEKEPFWTTLRLDSVLHICWTWMRISHTQVYLLLYIVQNKDGWLRTKRKLVKCEKQNSSLKSKLIYSSQQTFVLRHMVEILYIHASFGLMLRVVPNFWLLQMNSRRKVHLAILTLTCAQHFWNTYHNF